MRYRRLKEKRMGRWMVECLIGELPGGMLIDRHIRLYHNGELVMRSGAFATDTTVRQQFEKTVSRVEQLIKEEKGEECV